MTINSFTTYVINVFCLDHAGKRMKNIDNSNELSSYARIFDFVDTREAYIKTNKETKKSQNYKK